MRTRRASLSALLLAVGVFAAACGGSGEAVYRTDDGTQVGVAGSAGAVTLRPGDEIPAPSGQVVLTVAGLIRADADTPVQLDIATIDRIGLQTFSVYEPFAKQDMTFQGVDMRDLLEVMRPDDEAAELHLVALDDYFVNLSVADVRRGGTMLATHNGDGSPIAIEDGGPIRIVFTDGAKAGPTENEWIWSLATAEVR